MILADTYAYWDLIAEEAHKPNDNVLQNRTFDSLYSTIGNYNIFLFGCNAACIEFINNNNDLNIVGVFDNSPAKIGTLFDGKRVFDPKIVVPLLDEKENLVIIAMRLNADAIAKQLKELGFSNYCGLGVLVSGVEPYSKFILEMETLNSKPLENLILFESTNDFDGNSGSLYGYLKSNNSKHRYAWIVKNEENKKKARECDIAICPYKSVDELKEYIRLRATAKWLIWDNHPIRKVRDDQINIFLQHFGMGYKQVSKIVSTPGYVDYVLTPTEAVYKYEKEAWHYPKNAEIIFGELPRNDVLFSQEWNELSKVTKKKYNKVILWAPTLRESAMFNRIDSDIEYPMGISLLYTVEDMAEVNEFLIKENVLLIIKIHPRQKRNYTEYEYSNILYLDGKSSSEIHSYKLLTQVDAMITDYSSMVFDYMLLDRPIAWVLEDMNHYKIPFLMEKPLDFMPGNHIYNINDLFQFIGEIGSGVDKYKEQRNRLSDIYNAPKEGKGCERLVKFLGL